MTKLGILEEKDETTKSDDITKKKEERTENVTTVDTKIKDCGLIKLSEYESLMMLDIEKITKKEKQTLNCMSNGIINCFPSSIKIE